MNDFGTDNLKCKSNLYVHDTYTTDREYVLSNKITEYDMREAGWNVIQYFGLLNQSKIDSLKDLTKQERTIQIGKLERNDKTLSENKLKAFKEMRRRFIAANELEDDDIISIKRDAIFVSKRCEQTKYGSVEFAEKNVYTSFHQFRSARTEMYYNVSTNKLDIKGVSDSKLELHEKFLNILKRLFRYIENGDNKEFVKFMKRFVQDYKEKHLAYDYYREFNSLSSFRLDIILANNNIQLDNIDETVDSYLDISFNYIHYILPIMQRFYFK